MEEIEGTDEMNLWWTEDIEKIADPEIKEKEIESAKEIIDKEKKLKEKRASGKINKTKHELDYQFGLGKEKTKLATRSLLESVGITLGRRRRFG